MKIVLIDSNRERATELGLALLDLPTIGMLDVERAYYMLPPPGLDAVFMTLPAAERWRPDFKSRKAQVLTTSRDDQENGFPPFVVTGVNLTAEDPKDPVSQARIVLEAALDEVTDYNNRNDGRIASLGFWVTTFTRDGVTTSQLSELLHEILSCATPSGEPA